MPRVEPTIVDCYSAGERSLMGLGQRCRALLFAPVTGRLGRRGVTANQVTAASLVCGLAFAPAWFWSPVWALLLLALHALLDGLDGTLARESGSASRRGSFTDTMADQLVVAATTAVLMFDQRLSVPAGSLYLFLYTMVVVFAFLRNALEIPYSWLVRPRFVVFGAIAVDVFLLAGTLELVVWTSNLLLAVKMASGFFRIRQRL
jgi:phosphatidylglycerophosphate synthase